MLLTGAAMSQTRLNIIQLRESWTGMGISETIQYTDACHAILFQQFNCAAAFGNQAVVRTISNPHHDVVRISTSFYKKSFVTNTFNSICKLFPSQVLFEGFLVYASVIYRTPVIHWGWGRRDVGRRRGKKLTNKIECICHKTLL